MRRLTYTFTILFTLLTLLAAYGWWRSYYRSGDSAGWRQAPRQFVTLSYKGILETRWGTVSDPYPVDDGWFTTLAVARLWKDTFLGFQFFESHSKTPIEWDLHILRLPWYFLTLLPLLPLALCLRTIRRYRRQWLREKHGYCKTCGYDLRASTTTCPECGTTLPTQKRPPLTTPNPPKPS